METLSVFYAHLTKNVYISLHKLMECDALLLLKELRMHIANVGNIKNQYTVKYYGSMDKNFSK